MPYLVGGLIAIDLGVACLALFALFPATRSRVAQLIASVLSFLVLAIDIRLASRGPFLLLIVCLIASIAIVVWRTGPRHAAIRAAGLAVALVLAYRVASPLAEVAPPPTPIESAVAASATPQQPSTDAPPRVAQVEGYLSAQDLATKARLETFSAALGFIAEKPIFGWGGGLVGRDINGTPWDYAHNTLLDPLVETGVVGTVPYWGLFVFLGLSLIAALRRKDAIVNAVLPLLPLLAFAFLESLISGHVTNSRHMWLLVGMACGLLVRGNDVEETAVSSRETKRGAAAMVA
jgi:hypothetical protein